MKQDGATIHAFTSSMLRQTNFSCVSTYICTSSILLAFVTHAFHILHAETNKVPLPTSRHTYASHPSRLALVAPCVHIQHAETNQFLMRLDIHMQALHLVGFCRPVLILQRVPCVFTNPNNPPYPPSRHGDLKSPRPLQPPLVPHGRPFWPRSGTAFPCCP